jgi:predicted NBD/HSP70 family sugar kinase
LLRDERQGNRNESTRQHNLSVVLSYVHEKGPITRAELTRQTNLNRSTIGALVSELAQLGLVYETAPPLEQRSVGRPSPLVHPSNDIVALGVNPDFDAVQVSVVGFGGVVHDVARRVTSGPPTPEQSIEIVVDLVRELDAIRGRRVVGVGLAIPGLVNEYTQTVRLAPNLGWEDVEYSAMVQAALGYPTRAANDANLGVIAEYMFGAGRGCDNVVYLNGSTSGIGGGVVSDSRLVRGSRSFGAELGHTLVNSDGIRCGCGRTGCLETEVSIRRVWKVVGEEVAVTELDALYGDHDFGDLAAELDHQARALALGIANIVTVFSPERVILGGHLGALFDARRSLVESEVKRLALPVHVDGVTIVRNELRARMMAIGAAELAFAEVLRDPAGTLSALGVPLALSS